MATNEAYLIALIALGAFATPIISEKIKIPPAVGEIIYGIILGSTGINIQGELIKFLSELGFLILLFDAGTELSLSREIKGFLIKILPLAFVSVFFPFLLTLFFQFSIYLSLAAGSISVGMLVAFGKKINISGTTGGQRTMLFNSVGEIITLLVLAIAPLMMGSYGWIKIILRIFQIAVIFVIALTAFMMFKTLTWWFPKQIFNLVSFEDPSELGVRLAFAFVFVMVSLCVLFNIEPIVGAFLTGLIFSLVFKEKEKLKSKISSIGNGFLIPVFFIYTGAQFNVINLINRVDALLLVLLLCLLSLLSKLIGLYFLLKREISLREILGFTFLSSAPLTLIIAIGKVGFEEGYITAKQVEILIIFALVSGLLFPTLSKYFISYQKEPHYGG